MHEFAGVGGGKLWFASRWLSKGSVVIGSRCFRHGLNLQFGSLSSARIGDVSAIPSLGHVAYI